MLGRRADGALYDRFWGRVTFPIRDGSGRILGFGGRTLGSDHPKYLNSPESALCSQGSESCTDCSRHAQAIQEAERVVIVEGYLDTLALVEAGIGYAVASLGTALSTAQLRLARRFAPKSNRRGVFDGDRAGKEAAGRAFRRVRVDSRSVGSGCVSARRIRPGQLRAEARCGRDACDPVESATPLWDFFLGRHDPGPNAAVPERVRAAEEIRQVIRQCARSIPEYSLLAKQGGAASGDRRSVLPSNPTVSLARRLACQTAVDQVDPPAAFRPEEATLLEAMALDREVAVLVSHRSVLDAFSSRALADAGRALIAAWERDHNCNAAIDQLPPTIAERVTAGLLGEGPIATGDRLQAARDCIERIERRARRSEAREMLGDACGRPKLAAMIDAIVKRWRGRMSSCAGREPAVVTACHLRRPSSGA